MASCSYLCGQLACWRNDECGNLVLTWRRENQVLDSRQKEGERLSGPGFGLRQDITLLQNDWQSLSLNICTSFEGDGYSRAEQILIDE